MALAEQNESLAEAVFTRLTQALQPVARVQQAVQLLDLLLGNSPISANTFMQTIGNSQPSLLQEVYTPDRPLVQALVRVIETQGSQVDRVQLQERLREYWQMRRDMPEVLRQSDQVLAAARLLPPHTLVNTVYPRSIRQPVWMVYHDLLRYAYYHWPDSLPAITRRAQQDLGSWQTYIVTPTSVTPGPIIDFRTLSPEATLDTLWPGHARWQTAQRTTQPPLHADFWFPPLHTGKVVVPPVVGQVTFIMAGIVTAHAPFGVQKATLVRRMLEQYGTRGLAITVMTEARGWIDYGDYLRALEPLSPAAEAEQIRWYFQDYEGLPVTVGVNAAHYTKLPPPDGRISPSAVYHPFPAECKEIWMNEHCAMLVGRDGTILWQGDMLWTDYEGRTLDDGALLGIKSEFSDMLDKALGAVPPATTGNASRSGAETLPATQTTQTVSPPTSSPPAGHP